MAFAADASGALQVTASGDVVYSLPPGLRASLAARSFLLSAEPVLIGAAGIAGYLGRIAFGAMLLVSVAIVAAAVVALMVAGSSSSSSSDNRRSSSRSVVFMPRSGLGTLLDLSYMSDVFTYRSRNNGSRNQQGQGGMSFLESVFSFVFGDGDPNAGLGAARWRAVAAAVRAAGGVVTAEQLAPYLEPPAAWAAGLSKRPATRDDVIDIGSGHDEAWVLPALSRFNGAAVVDDAGRLFYRFSELQKFGEGGAAKKGGAPPPLAESARVLTSAGGVAIAAAVGLGVANLAGIIYLGPILYTPTAAAALGPGFVTLLRGLYPLLQVYGVSFFAVPLVRWVMNMPANAAIDGRNAARAAAARALASPPPALAAKLAAAKAQASKVVITSGDIIYDSSKAAAEQPAVAKPVIESEAAEFERRLAARSAAREGRALAGSASAQPAPTGPMASSEKSAEPGGPDWLDYAPRPGEDFSPKAKRGRKLP